MSGRRPTPSMPQRIRPGSNTNNTNTEDDYEPLNDDPEAVSSEGDGSSSSSSSPSLSQRLPDAPTNETSPPPPPPPSLSSNTPPLNQAKNFIKNNRVVLPYLAILSTILFLLVLFLDDESATTTPPKTPPEAAPPEDMMNPPTDDFFDNLPGIDVSSGRDENLNSEGYYGYGDAPGLLDVKEAFHHMPTKRPSVGGVTLSPTGTAVVHIVPGIPTASQTAGGEGGGSGVVVEEGQGGEGGGNEWPPSDSETSPINLKWSDYGYESGMPTPDPAKLPQQPSVAENNGNNNNVLPPSDSTGSFVNLKWSDLGYASGSPTPDPANLPRPPSDIFLPPSDSEGTPVNLKWSDLGYASGAPTPDPATLPQLMAPGPGGGGEQQEEEGVESGVSTPERPIEVPDDEDEGSEINLGWGNQDQEDNEEEEELQEGSNVNIGWGDNDQEDNDNNEDNGSPIDLGWGNNDNNPQEQEEDSEDNAPLPPDEDQGSPITLKWSDLGYASGAPTPDPGTLPQMTSPGGGGGGDEDENEVPPGFEQVPSNEDQGSEINLGWGDQNQNQETTASSKTPTVAPVYVETGPTEIVPPNLMAPGDDETQVEEPPVDVTSPVNIVLNPPVGGGGGGDDEPVPVPVPPPPAPVPPPPAPPASTPVGNPQVVTVPVDYPATGTTPVSGGGGGGTGGGGGGGGQQPPQQPPQQPQMVAMQPRPPQQQQQTQPYPQMVSMQPPPPQTQQSLPQTTSGFNFMPNFSWTPIMMWQQPVFQQYDQPAEEIQMPLMQPPQPVQQQYQQQLPPPTQIQLKPIQPEQPQQQQQQPQQAPQPQQNQPPQQPQENVQEEPQTLPKAPVENPLPEEVPPVELTVRETKVVQPKPHNWEFNGECWSKVCAINEEKPKYGMANEDDAIYEIYYTNPPKCCGVIVEIGAGDGLTNSASHFFEHGMGWRSVLIEADPTKFEELEKNRPNAINVNAAFCEGDNSHLTYGYSDESFHAMDGYTEVISEKHAAAPLLASEEDNSDQVDCINLQQVFDNLKITHVDVMIIKVEGDPLAVVRKMDWTVRVDIWIVLLDSDPDTSGVRDQLVRTVLESNEYVQAEWDIKRWCEVEGQCLQNEVFLRKGFNPLPKQGQTSRRLTEILDDKEDRRRLLAINEEKSTTMKWKNLRG